MTKYAKIVEDQLAYPRSSEFAGIPNYKTNDQALRRAGYTPLIGEADPRPGFTPVPSAWHVVEQSETRTEPRQVEEDIYGEDPETHERVKIGVRIVIRDVDVVFDTSYIQVDDWIYEMDPEPVPPVVRYSKYKLKNACVSRDLWDSVRTAIENAGKWESFLLINDIASDNPELVEVMPMLVETFGEELVRQVLSESIAD